MTMTCCKTNVTLECNIL